MSHRQIQCQSCGVVLRVREGNTISPDRPCPKCDEPIGGRRTRSRDQAPRQVRSKKTTNQNSTRQLFWLGVSGGVLAILVLIGLSIVGVLALLDRGDANSQLANNSAETTPALLEQGTTGDATDQKSTKGSVPAINAEFGSAQTSGPSSTTGMENQSVATAPSASLPVATQRMAPTSLSLPATFTPTDSTPWVTYEWKDGDQYSYTLELDAVVNGAKYHTMGSCDLEVTSRQQPIPATTANGESGTGTAFVVNPNGILLTCAHVVESAVDIEVELGGKSYSAEVIDVNEVEDLAILRINASSLPTLVFADSSTAQIGQDVRVAGYPLADVLGTQIKVTTGTISGIVVENNQRRFQVDAAINPGNSGGPLVNSQGEVMGIASAKLYGEAVSSVGFCVPGNSGVALLGQHKIPLPVSDSTTQLSGPDLVAKVSPAIGLVRVKLGNVGSASCKMSMTANATTFNRSVLFNPPQTSFARGSVQVSDLGEVIQGPEGANLPFLMGSVAQYPFLKLPKHRRESWSTTAETALVESHSNSGRGAEAILRQIYGQGRDVTNIIPATERWDFRLLREDDEIIVLTMVYEFRTRDDEQRPRALVGTTGEAQFNKTRGMLTSFKSEGVCEQNTALVSHRIPVNLTFVSLTQEQSKRKREESEQRRKESAEKLARTERGRTSTDPRETAEDPEAIDPRIIAQTETLGWGVKSLAITPDGRMFIAGKADNEVEVFETATGKKLFVDKDATSEHQQITCVSVSPNGKMVIAGGYEGEITVYELAENGLLSRKGTFEEHDGEIACCSWSPNSELVLTGDSDSDISCWNVKTRKELFSTSKLKGRVMATAFDMSTQTGIGVDRNGNTLVFSLKDGEVVQQKKMDIGYCDKASITPDGKNLLLNDGYDVQDHGVQTGVHRKLKGKESTWVVIAVLERNLIVSGGRGKLQTWDMTTGFAKEQIVFHGVISYIQHLAASTDGRYLVAAPEGARGRVFILDLTKKPGEAEQ